MDEPPVPARGHAPVDPYQPPRAAADPEREDGLGRASFADIVANFPLALRRSWATAAGPFALLGLATLVFVSGPAVGLQAMQRGLLETDVSLGGSLAMTGLLLLASFLALAMSLVIGTFGTGLVRAVRLEMVAGPGAVAAAGGAFRLALGRFWPVLANSVLVGLGLALGLVLCVLPVLGAIYFFFLAPYLVAACDAGPWEGIVRSVKVALRNVGTFVALTAIAAAAMAIYYTGVSLVSLSLTASLGMTQGQIVAQVLLQVVGLPLGFLAFVFYTAAAVTVETSESGTPLSR